MKITQLFKIYWPDNGGGIAKVMESIAQGFLDCEQELIVCQSLRHKPCTQDTYQGIPVRRCRQLFDLLSTPISLQFLYDVKKRTKNSDIVIYHFPYPMADLAVLFGFCSGRLVVWWHCGFDKYKMLAPFYRPLVAHTLKKADRILVSSKGNIKNSKTLRRFCEKCTVIPFCVSDECLLRGRAYAQSRFYEEDSSYEENRTIQEDRPIQKDRTVQEDRPIQKDRTVQKDRSYQEEKKSRIGILFIGRLVWYKGCDILLKAFALLQKKYRTVCSLTIVGSGPLEQELKALAASLKLKHVMFTGMVTEEEKMSHIEACDFLVLPSISKAEAFAVVQLEAMAFGKPVINTALNSGVPYVSIDGITGKTVKPGSVKELAAAMQELAENEQLRKDYGQHALQLIQAEYTHDLMIKRHRKIFAKLLLENTGTDRTGFGTKSVRKHIKND